MIRDVLRMGDPRLWEKSLPVEQFDTPELAALLQDMRDTMAHLSGAGLAAPQIGVPLRVVIFGVHANPRYPDVDEVPDTVLGMRGWVPRYTKLKYSGYDEHGKRFVREVSGFHARVVQHECDHLDGVLYPMRIRDFTKFGFNDALFPGQALPAEE
jgi:peptide deformylase